MSGATDRRFLEPCCVVCGETIRFDVAGYDPHQSVPLTFRCPDGHDNDFVIRGQVIRSHTRTHYESNINSYIDVPDHIKDVIQQAHKCTSEDLPIAGIGAVRRALDELLYDMGHNQRQLGDKVTDLETQCRNQTFRQSNPTLCRRVSTFRTISRLAGYHLHAQGNSVFNLQNSDVSSFLHLVEGAIKEHWPGRRQ